MSCHQLIRLLSSVGYYHYDKKDCWDGQETLPATHGIVRLMYMYVQAFGRLVRMASVHHVH